MVRWRQCSFLAALAAMVALPATGFGQTILPFAHYRLGEEDLGTPAPGGSPELNLTLDEIKYNGIERDLLATGNPVYSNFVPPGGYSTLSMKFDGASDVGNPATNWFSEPQPGGNFRITMEAWVWPDPVMQNTEFVPFANGSGMGLVGTQDGHWTLYGTGGFPTDAGDIKYGEWQHIAFTTSGSHWNFYVDGDQTVSQFFGNYGGTGGDLTIGGDLNGERRMVGYVDEARISRWLSPDITNRDPQIDDFLLFSNLAKGDVNGDDVVDANDYDIWRTNVGSDVSELTAFESRGLGDLNHDKVIDLDDFAIIKANHTPGASPVPEPSSLALAALAICSLAGMRLRKRAGIAALTTMTALYLAGTAHAQNPLAVWSGADANWNSANWSGGTGAGGAPSSTDDVEFHAGTADITSNVGAYQTLFTREGGTINVAPSGSVEFANVNLANAGGVAYSVLNVAGTLTVPGTLAFARGADGNSNPGGEFNISGSAVVHGGDFDGFWGAPSGTVSVTGPDADIQFQTLSFGISDLRAHITAGTHSTMKAPSGTDVFSEFSNGGESELFVDFELGGFTPTLGHSWTLIDTSNFTRNGGSDGRFNVNHVGDLGVPGLRGVVSYRAGGENGQILAVDVVNNLNLKVDTSTGVATLENPTVGGSAFSIDGVMITSASGSLVGDGYDGLGVAGWQPGLSQSDSVLSESNLLGSTSIAIGDTFDLGSIFSAGGAQDLVFQFHVAGGASIRGTVEYVEGPSGQVGDTDNDGDVDLDDLNAVRNNFGAEGPVGGTPGDAVPFDGKVDLDDLNGVRNNFGVVGGSQSVPEPSTVVLALGLGISLAGVAWRRRK